MINSLHAYHLIIIVSSNRLNHKEHKTGFLPFSPCFLLLSRPRCFRVNAGGSSKCMEDIFLQLLPFTYCTKGYHYGMVKYERTPRCVQQKPNIEKARVFGKQDMNVQTTYMLTKLYISDLCRIRCNQYGCKIKFGVTNRNWDIWITDIISFLNIANGLISVRTYHVKGTTHHLCLHSFWRLLPRLSYCRIPGDPLD